MGKRNIIYLWLVVIFISIFAACNNGVSSDSSDKDKTEDNSGTDTGNADADSTNSGVIDSTGTAVQDSVDYSWDSSNVIPIYLNGTSITVKGNGATASGSVVTITSAGTYGISGTLNNGQIIVDSSDNSPVRIILSSATIKCSTSATIYIKNSDETEIILAPNTSNIVTDGTSYTFDVAGEEEPNAAIFSKDELKISGSGSLTVKGNYNDGISSKDELKIESGVISVTSVDDGIRGKDFILVKGGQLTIKSTGDGLKSDNETDAKLGYIDIESGIIKVTSGNDAFDAATKVIIADGTIDVSSGGGSGVVITNDTSAKGIKGSAGVIIGGGTFSLNSADDAIHSNGIVEINGGSFAIASGDDGIHSDSLLTISAGTINITKSYEGIESAYMTINGGDIHLNASDDGINGAGGTDSSGTTGIPNQGTGGGFVTTGNYSLAINGGYIYINAKGDGIDVNGSITMSNGEVIVNGPTDNGNGPIDYDTTFKLTGGFIIAAGSSGMAMAPSTTSTVNSVLFTLRTGLKAGVIFNVQKADGTGIVTFAPVKNYQSVLLSSPALIKGTTYNVYTGGSSTGTVTDGLYQNGTYSPGTSYTSFTVSSVITNINK